MLLNVVELQLMKNQTENHKLTTKTHATV